MSNSALKLEVVEGPDAGMQVSLLDPVLVGRGAAASLRLSDPLVSHRHARITARDSAAVVEDLGSTNGTFVNGVRVQGPQRLAPGGELVVGTSVMQLASDETTIAGPTVARPVPAALAAPQRQPTYLGAAPARPLGPTGVPELTSLLDVRTRAQARLAPLAIVVLVALALVVYFVAR